ADSLSRLGEIAAGIAHELRNSLATLRGYLTLVARRPDEEALTDYVGEMRRETEHLQRVLDDFLSFARPGSTHMQQGDLHAGLRRAAGDPARGEARIVLDQPSPEPCGTIAGDPLLLERAFRNLLHNAVQAEVAHRGRAEDISVGVRRVGEQLA